jgi:H+/Cl- antiporter ClcA
VAFAYIVALSVAFTAVGSAAYCLYTGLNPFNNRRWYDRSWRVVAGALISYLAVLFFFGDS